ncbi:MAG: anti-sigma factor [Saprospiraceae bacterium]|nr:anti-sigma factor [Saprospiraceae bacterium]
MEKLNKNEFLESGLLEQYVLKIATPEEEAIVEEYAQHFPEIAAQIKEMQAALEAYAMQHAVPPPPGMKKQVLSELNTPASASRLSFGTGLLIAACIALALTSFLLFKTQSLYKVENQNLQIAFSELETSCLEKEKQSEAIAQQLHILRAPSTKRVQLLGTANAPDADVAVYWNEQEATGLLQIAYLPPIPEGKTYQIWADVDGVMINAGLFNGENFDLQNIQFIARAESLNITLEPAGGSDHPTVEFLQANGKV